MYDFNKKAWMTATIFTSWVRKFDAEMVRQKRKVILFLDNCSAHPTVADLRAVRLQFLPANTTAKTQPCDAGIIRSLKLQYRKRLMSCMLAWYDSNKDMRAFSISLLDALSMVKEAWANVTPSTVQNSFRQCGFLSSTTTTAAAETEEVPHEFDRLETLNLINTGIDLENVIDVDAGLATHELPAEKLCSNPSEEMDAGTEDDDIDDCGEDRAMVTTAAANDAIEKLKTFAMQNNFDDNLIVSFERMVSQRRITMA